MQGFDSSSPAFLLEVERSAPVPGDQFCGDRAPRSSSTLPAAEEGGSFENGLAGYSPAEILGVA
eukprot:4983057-Pyramimonas_sp.AAC.1